MRNKQEIPKDNNEMLSSKTELQVNSFVSLHIQKVSKTDMLKYSYFPPIKD